MAIGDENKFDGISIHALVKRATHEAVYLKNSNVISIHALVKRATVPQKNNA